MSKKTVYIAVFIGSIIGGYIPMIWGEGFLSISSIIFSGLGGLLGIFLVLKFFR